MPVSPKFVEKHRKEIERHTCGLKIGNFLGSGVWGSVFETNDNRWVVKITEDLGEGPAAKKIMHLRKFPIQSPASMVSGVVEILSVTDIKLESYGKDLQIIVREKVAPIEGLLDPDILKIIDRSLMIIENTSVYFKKDVSLAFQRLTNHAPHLAQSIKDLKIMGYRMIDMSIFNLGTTFRSRLGIPRNSIVIFDVSFKWTDEANRWLT